MYAPEPLAYNNFQRQFGCRLLFENTLLHTYYSITSLCAAYCLTLFLLKGKWLTVCTKSISGVERAGVASKDIR